MAMAFRITLSPFRIAILQSEVIVQAADPLNHHRLATSFKLPLVKRSRGLRFMPFEKIRDNGRLARFLKKS